MAFTFDSLAYAKHLESAGVARDIAEAHAEAVRGFVMSELVTKEDLRLALDNALNRMTIRLGSMLGAGVAFLAVLIKLT